METGAIMLSVRAERVDVFEAGFRRHEVPIWEDCVARGAIVGAWLNRMDISSQPDAGGPST